MARLRRRRVTVEGVPAELSNRYSPLWDDPLAVIELAATHGFTLNNRLGRDVAQMLPIERFGEFRRAYCIHAGLMSDKFPGIVDHNRARAAGIDMQGISRDRVLAGMSHRGYQHY